MNFVLINAPYTFQHMMDQLCAYFPFVQVYLEDVLTLSQSTEENLDHLEEFPERLSKHNMKVKVSKYDFAQPEIMLLGHFVDENGVSVDTEKIGEILKTPSPTASTELRIFIGISGYYRHFIKNFADK